MTASSLLFAASAVKLRSLAPSVRAAVVPPPDDFPLCVTVNVRVIPPPVTVIFAVRDVVPVFAATLYTIFPFPLPLAVFTTSHDADDFTVQDTLAVTASSLLFAASAVKLRSFAPSVSVTGFSAVNSNLNTLSLSSLSSISPSGSNVTTAA